MGAGFTGGIHEDYIKQTLVEHTTGDPRSDRSPRFSAMTGTCQGVLSNATTIAQPAQRLPDLAAAIAQRPTNRRRRVSALLAERRNHIGQVTTEPPGLEPKNLSQETTLRRRPSRMTIFIPPDDTTLQTIHPGAISTKYELAKRHERITDIPDMSESSSSQGVTSAWPRISPRKSLTTTVPGRLPLETISRASQEMLSVSYRAGRGRGKENIPPGGVGNLNSLYKYGKAVTTAYSHRLILSANRTEAIAGVPGVTGCKAVGSRKAAPSCKRPRRDALESSQRKKMPKEKHGSPSPAESHGSAQSDISSDWAPHAPSTRAAVKVHSKPEKYLVAKSMAEHHEKYPLLSDVLKPELYEDNWLSHQEAAITQLVNTLFETSEESERHGAFSNDNLREKLLHTYHEPPFPPLHNRIQASLLYGALSIPQDINANVLRLEGDVGLRREFLDLWINTYELAPLKAAAEVVIGRQLFEASRMSKNSSDNEARRARREMRALETFLDVFLVRNEDAIRSRQGIDNISCGHGTDINAKSAGHSGQRTILRSLLLILLLDKAKFTKTFSSRLFLPSSPCKSSASVLNALARMLLPSIGDVPRTLGHLGYAVQHLQYPLEEYTYKITNLATDLRDGVRLTHLIELLLYSPASVSREPDAITVKMPTCTACAEQGVSCIPSHRLKFPCAARSQKLYNVEIALNALCGVRGVCNVAKGLKADDIVDGYREKTIGLLWALVSQCGLSTLLDWRELEREMHRLNGGYHGDRELASREGSDSHTCLLVAWARSIARLHGLDVGNLSTAFADGEIFKRIVDEYAACLPAAQDTSIGASWKEANLETKLRKLDCNHYFVLGSALCSRPTNIVKHRSSADHVTQATFSTVNSYSLLLPSLHLASLEHQRDAVQQ
ncbi:MAG: hypothetical protein M1830_009425 [Pleopsidium flavum]|nr:MAG: hypothetical protein M1830_009425 [Pleopsidium flavum]